MVTLNGERSWAAAVSTRAVEVIEISGTYVIQSCAGESGRDTISDQLHF